MSPEQAHGDHDAVGSASDVYSLGATLYHVLCGQPSQQGTDLRQILANVQTGVFPKPRSIKPQIPDALEAICLKAMFLRPEDRYASPATLLSDLEQWLADEPVAALPDKFLGRIGRWMRKHHTLTSIAVSLSIIVGLSIGFVQVAKARDVAEHERSRADTQRNIAVEQRQIAEQEREEANRQRSMTLLLSQALGTVQQVNPLIEDLKEAKRPGNENIQDENVLAMKAARARRLIDDFFKKVGAVGTSEPTGNRDFETVLAQAEVQGAELSKMLADAQGMAQWSSRAISRLNEVHGRMPQDSAARSTLLAALRARAYALHRQEQFQTEAVDLNYMLEFDDELVIDRGRLRLERAYAFARGGQHAEATREAKLIAQDYGTDPGIVYGTATVHALAYESIQQDANADPKPIAESYAATAIEVLKKLNQANVFTGDSASLLEHHDLKSIRQRAGFPQPEEIQE
jgi:hypothetical protein